MAKSETMAGSARSCLHRRFVKACLLLATLAGSDFIVPNSATAAEPNEAAILTPAQGKAPRINGPKVFGVRPEHPIVFTIPATGARPIPFSADNLPEGVT